MGSVDDQIEEEIAKLKERLKLVTIEDIIEKAKMHAAQAYSHAKEAYSLRDDFFKLIEQHADADLHSGTKERLSLAAASLNTALGVADAAVATANIAARAADSAQGKPSLLDYNLLASSEAIPRAYESILVKDEKATNFGSDEREATKDLISEDAAALEVVAAANIAISATHSDQGKPALLAAKNASTNLDSGERSVQREAVRANNSLISEDVALAVADATVTAANITASVASNIAASVASSDQGNSAFLAAKTASTSLNAGEIKVQREALACGKQDLLREEEIRLEEEGCVKKTSLERMARLEASGEAMAGVREDAALEAVADANVAASVGDSNQDSSALIPASTKLDYGARMAHRKAVREGLARGKIDFLREEERRKLEEEEKAERERKKKKREEENKMRDDKRKQKMDKNTKPKDKDKDKVKK